MTHRAFILVLLSLAPLVARAEALPPLGYWTDSLIEGGADYALLKVAAFHRSGKVTPRINDATLRKTCGAPVTYVAWVAHRLSKGEALSLQVGRRLGTELAPLLARGCFSAVSLDVEPLPRPPSWLGEFVQGIKEKVALPLSLAVPPLSRSPRKGLTWKPDEALKVLSGVDGLDFMIYDVGEDKNGYQEVVHETIRFAAEPKTWGKTLTFGLPSYPEQPLHSVKVENLTGVDEILRNLVMDRSYCGPKRRLAVYSAQTRAPADDTVLDRIRKRWAKECS